MTTESTEVTVEDNDADLDLSLEENTEGETVDELDSDTEELDGTEDPEENTTEDDSTETEQEEDKPASKLSEKELSRKYTVKIDGEEQKIPLKELITGYQVKQLSHQKIQEAQLLSQQAQQFVKLVRDNPTEVLREILGDQYREAVEDWLAEQIQYESMDDGQRELVDAKRKLAQYEQEKRAAEEAQRQTSLAQQRESLRVEINEAIANADLPQNDWVFNRYVDYLREAARQQIPISNAKDVTDFVKRDLKALRISLEGSDKSTQQTVKKVVQKKPPVVPKDQQGEKRDKKEKKKGITMSEFRDFLES